MRQLPVLLSLLALGAHAEGPATGPTNLVSPAALAFDRALFASPSATPLPDWIGAVGYDQGELAAAPAAWHGPASLPEGAGRVWIDLNRAKLDEDLSLTLLYERSASADLAIQLCDAEGRVVALDLFQSALAVADQARTATFVVPVRSYPTATRIVLRRVLGDVRLYGAVLAPVLSAQPGDLDVLLELSRRLGDPLSPESDLVRRIRAITEAGAGATNSTVRSVPRAPPVTLPSPAVEADESAWHNAGNYPVACGMLAATVVDGRIYAMGGYNGAWLSQVHSLDPANPGQGWRAEKEMPVIRACLAAVTANGRIYSIGGYQDNYSPPQSQVYAYDPRHPDQGWVGAGELPVRLFRHAAAAVDGKILVMGGVTTNGAQSAVYEYDTAKPENGWRLLNNLPGPRNSLSAAVLNGLVYAVGGSDEHEVQPSVYAFDPASPDRGWRSIANLPAPRYVSGAVGANGKLYVAGGFGPEQAAVDTVYAYDPARPSLGWVDAGALPSVRGEAPMAEAGGRLFLISGAIRPCSYQASVFEVVLSAPASGGT
jgi:N-acetylneuraminic acid mutarotase